MGYPSRARQEATVGMAKPRRAGTAMLSKRRRARFCRAGLPMASAVGDPNPRRIRMGAPSFSFGKGWGTDLVLDKVFASLRPPPYAARRMGHPQFARFLEFERIRIVR